MRAESRAKMAEFELKGDPFILGTQEPTLTFSVEQLEAMLAQAKASQSEGEVAQ